MLIERSLLITICLIIFSSTFAFSQKNQIRVGYIPNPPDGIESCGTRLYSAVNPDGPKIFVFADDENHMKLNGKLVKFKLLDSNEMNNNETEVGKTFWRTYRSDKFDVKIDYNVVLYSDNSVQYEGVIGISKSKFTRKVQFVGTSSC